jgi:hypothetical protein
MKKIASNPAADGVAVSVPEIDSEPDLKKEDLENLKREIEKGF